VEKGVAKIMSKWKGIILAGGNGTRLSPHTLVTSKHLLPVYDKPLIYYSLSVLIYAGIRDVLLIVNQEHIDQYKVLLADGAHLGMNIQYMIQSEPRGIADAFIVGENFIGSRNVALVLGDNIFHGMGFLPLINKAMERSSGCSIFTYPVDDPSRFGVLTRGDDGMPLKIEEKPKDPKSNQAITGLYFLDNSCIEKSKKINPSSRNELEITSLLQQYMDENSLLALEFGRGFAWLDTGTNDAMLDAARYIQLIEKRQGLKVACIEELAFLNKWITKEDLNKISLRYFNTSYAKYLKDCGSK
tara:strand:- start:14052 stop:14951 length:900 start_codon:yes stop_codon:yes gene_type:complete